MKTLACENNQHLEVKLEHKCIKFYLPNVLDFSVFHCKVFENVKYPTFDANSHLMYTFTVHIYELKALIY